MTARVAERMLTQRELNRALLARQLLLEREKLPVPRAIERVGGLQTQDSRSGYIGLWSRLEGFERDDLTRALERRSVVQGTVMRITIHTVSARDYWLFTEGIRRLRRESWTKSHAKRADMKKMPSVSRRAESLLADGPRWRRELMEELGIDAATFNGIGMWVDLLRAPPSGTWERPRGDLYATADEWLARKAATEEEGREHLLRRYLGAFGPATLNEAANWAGLPAKVLAPAVETLRLRRFRAEDGAELLDLPRAPLPDPETPAPPRFLPPWDATLLAHARRAEILPEEHRAKVFNPKTPHTLTAFLVDGHASGTWKFERGRVTLDPFGRIAKDARRELDQEAERLAEFAQG
jgi:8-oxo-dGTP pyrophosphatase MutT (NUDIX family)